MHDMSHEIARLQGGNPDQRARMRALIFNGLSTASTMFRSWVPRLSRLQVDANAILSDLAIEPDEHGSPVTLDPVEWIVCFVPGLRRQWWHLFADERHKHVFAMRPLDDGCWLLVEPWWKRMMVTVLSPSHALKFLQWGEAGDMLRVREAIPGTASQFRGWSNCAVLTAFVLGRSSRTWTPHGLYRELVRENDVVPISVEQLPGLQPNAVPGPYRRVSDAAQVEHHTLFQHLTATPVFVEGRGSTDGR